MPVRTAARHDADAAGVLGRAVLRAATSLGLTQRQLARAIGVSEASVSRLARGRPIDPEEKEGELALLFLRAWRSLDALVGGRDEDARAWVHAENRHLGGRPADLLQSTTGLVRVCEYLDALRGKL